jgi:hypothetical protein
MQFKAFETGIEVNGQTAYAIIDGFKEFKQVASTFLLQEGIGRRRPDGLAQVDPGAWFAQEAWLRAFENIATRLGDAALFRIGMAIPKNARFPPWVADIDSAIRSIDIAYHMNHRRQGKELFDAQSGALAEGIGHYGYLRKHGKSEIVSVCNNPYPCAFDRGILTAMARRFQARAVVTHDDTRACRKRAADSCTFIIAW